MTYSCGNRTSAVTRELTARGYAVGNSGMAVPSIHIRVREDSGDRAESRG